MRRHALLVLGMGALIAALAAGIAAAAEGELTSEVGFVPKRLSKTNYTPIRASLSQHWHGPAHPPAERELRIELDRNVMIRTKGLPACHLGPQTGVSLEEACADAVIGSGEEIVQVAFAESTPINVPAKVQIFNGGERDGAITMYVYGSFTAPISGVLLTKVVVTRIHNGRFGWLADAQFPQVAGGSGSVVDLSLAIGRGVLSAKCTDGKLQFHLQAIFEDGTSGETEITRACTPYG
jgi:hypothetical protein